MTITYTAEDLRKIAAISENEHLGLLTDFGISRDQARMIVGATDEMLAKGAEMGRQNLARLGNSERASQIAAVVSATEREIIIRQA